MRILSIDTSTDFLTLGLSDDKKILIEDNTFGAKSMGERLQVSLSHLLKDQDIDFSSIDAYAAAKGPGSFTGLRIGITAVKTFARLYDKPVIPISTLKAIAYNIYGDNIVCPILDARRDRVYSAIYEFKGSEIIELLPEGAYEIEDLRNKIKKFSKVIMTGSGTELYGEFFSKGTGVVFPGHSFLQPKAASLLALAEIAFEKGETVSPYDLTPNYLKPSQAEREKNA